MLKVFNKITVIRKLYVCSMTLQCSDNKLCTFQKICDEIAAEPKYLEKAEILKRFFRRGTNGKAFTGDVILWVQMLIPNSTQRVYNLQNKQMLKLFARIFAQDRQAMELELQRDGDISETLRRYFETSEKFKPQTESTLYLQEVDEFLSDIAKSSKEEEQMQILRQLCKRSTSLDLRTVVRLIKQDLRINARARHILDAFSSEAYPSFQASRDLIAVVKEFSEKIILNNNNVETTKLTKANAKTNAKVGSVSVMTPISPMLAKCCRSVDDAFKKSPKGIYSEIKYDGERVQIHKSGEEFKFFSRNLKPVVPHKVKRFHEFIPKAFPNCDDMILDSEIILVDTVTDELLPFGTLGAHKKLEYTNAEVCLFVFDCIFYNGEDLTNLTFRERRKILEDNIAPIKSYVQLSESNFLKTKQELSVMTAKVLKANLEGVVLKNPSGTYQPGKRGWLKVKKDYLFGGKMADTADLVVLGGWYGSGKKGGILSIFLMGCYDPIDSLWKTVTKVHSGLDDATNDEIHEKLMVEMQRADPDKLPIWLDCKKALVPDYLAIDPNKMPVWEITGAEFTTSDAHTAGGISIRFPRISRLRDDKTSKEATTVEQLQKLQDVSKHNINVDLLLNGVDDTSQDSNSQKTPKKVKNKRKNGIDDETHKAEASGSDKKRSKPEAKISNAQKKMMSNFLKPSKTTASTSTNSTTYRELSTTDSTTTLVDSSEKQRDIFKNVVAYFSPDIADAQLTTSFVLNGGTVVNDSFKANIAFYATVNESVELPKLRQKYKRSCRHLSVKWIHESLMANAQEPYPIYALVLN